MKRRSLTVKLAALVLGISTLILGAVLVYNLLFSQAVIIRLAEDNSRSLGREVANHLAAQIKPIELAVKNIALALEDSALNSREITSLARRIVEGNEDVFGMTVAFEPFGISSDKLFFAPYSYRTDSGVKTTSLGGTGYRYFYMDWYQLAKELGCPVWTEPYFEESGASELMTTYSVPFYRLEDGQRRFIGVVTADISLKWLQHEVSSIKLYDTGYALITTHNGTFISHPVEELVLNQTVFSLAEGMGDQELWEIGRNMIEGKTGFLRRASVRDNKESFLLYMPLPIGGWSLAFLFPVDEVFADVRELSRNMLLIGGLGFLVLTGAVIWISRKITKPVRDLSDVALQIAQGNLDAKLPDIRTRDEVGDLAIAFGEMQSSIKEFIVDLTETTAQKERIESELRIGRDIQMGILPKIFPAFTEYAEFDIYASVEPAKEVGGDLYDFFLVDENHFCFLIGDVSGKGVPAAFFMAVTKTLLKVVAERGVSPGAILEKVNNDLAEDNESCMFVTLFVAVLDIRTGEVNYASAGHNPPVLLENSGVKYLKPLNEPLAGAMTGMTYTTSSLTLKPGDTLFLYTDGVTEAMNKADELYTDERLIVFMKGLYENDAKSMIEAVNQSVLDFSGGADQSDDITMLTLKYLGMGK